MNLRYHLFAGDDYYPLGGWEDWRGAFATIEEALVAAADTRRSQDWWHIVDIAEHKIIRKSI